MKQATASAVHARAKRGAEARDWSWVEASVWTERMVSALENGVKGGRWYSLMDKVGAPDTLEAAWDKVQANGGVAGVDGQSLERFAAQEELYLTELATALREDSYRPQPVKRVDIPKGDGKTRPLGIPTVKDRIVQTAVKFVLEPIFEATFCPTSYGFRPGLGCRDALREVAQLIEEGYTFVVDADLQSYFDTIPHERLMQRVEERISDGRILGLLRSWLAQDILRDTQGWTPTEGTPDGGAGLSDGALCGRLRGAVQEPRRGRGRFGGGWRLRRRQRPASASGQDPYRRLPKRRGRLRVPRLSVRSRAASGPQEEPAPPQGPYPGEDETHTRRQPRVHCRRSQSDTARLVRLLQACPSGHLCGARQVHPQTATLAPAQAGQASRLRSLSGRPSTLAQCLLRSGRAARTTHSLADRETLPMRKPPTGEPYAGKPPVRFGGRGG